MTTRVDGLNMEQWPGKHMHLYRGYICPEFIPFSRVQAERNQWHRSLSKKRLSQSQTVIFLVNSLNKPLWIDFFFHGEVLNRWQVNEIDGVDSKIK